jgi:hypothetical protein
VEPATILILVLSAGVLALLVWFEINSRRNEARKKQGGNLPPPELSSLPKETEGGVPSETGDKRAA